MTNDCSKFTLSNTDWSIILFTYKTIDQWVFTKIPRVPAPRSLDSRAASHQPVPQSSHQSESVFWDSKNEKYFCSTCVFQFTFTSLFYRICESEWRIWIGNPCFIASWLSYSLHFVEAENIWWNFWTMKMIYVSLFCLLLCKLHTLRTQIIVHALGTFVSIRGAL